MSEAGARCQLCGEPMSESEQMFKYHGYSGPCPKPPLPKEKREDDAKLFMAQRILYQLERQGLVVVAGGTVDEKSANIKRANELMRDMMKNGER